MGCRMRPLLVALVAFLAAGAPATADNYYNASRELLEQKENTDPVQKLMKQEEAIPSGRHVVTSVQDCLDKLPEEDAADIRSKSIKPYEDCQKRLQVRAREKKEEAEKDEAEEAEAETPSNFLRVTEAEDSPKTGEAKKSENRKMNPENR